MSFARLPDLLLELAVGHVQGGRVLQIAFGLLLIGEERIEGAVPASGADTLALLLAQPAGLPTSRDTGPGNPASGEPGPKPRSLVTEKPCPTSCWQLAGVASRTVSPSQPAVSAVENGIHDRPSCRLTEFRDWPVCVPRRIVIRTTSRDGCESSPWHTDLLLRFRFDLTFESDGRRGASHLDEKATGGFRHQLL